MALNFPSSEKMAALPWFVRFLLGCCMAAAAVALTSSIAPLRAFPLLLTFPVVILAAWFLEMWGAAGCALMGIALIDAFLTRAQFRFASGNASEKVRLGAFLLVTMVLSWSMRRLAKQRAELQNQELKRQLERAESERRLAEERANAGEQIRYQDQVLQIALQASGMGLWVWDLEKELVHRSDQVFRIVGSEPGSFGSQPEEWLKFVLPEDVPALDAAFARARSEGADYHMQYRVRWPEGSIHWVESQGRCQRNEQGKVVRIYGVMADITQRKQSEEGMLRAEKLAVAGRLAASVAHEINNPLEAVANLLYLITMTDSADTAREWAAQALDELMRISLVAQSTLKFHRESGAPKPTLLSEVLDAVLTMFRGRLQSTEIAVQLRSSEEFAICCMPSEMYQIFANLIANSIEAMERNGRMVIRLRPSRDWRDRSRRGMRVSICDNGSGIDRATLTRIFEPFFTTKTETGTGLGLWVVQELVERHRGSFHVWSSQRQGSSGTVFSVFLPGGRAEELQQSGGAGGVQASFKQPDRESPEQNTRGLSLQRQSA